MNLSNLKNLISNIGHNSSTIRLGCHNLVVFLSIPVALFICVISPIINVQFYKIRRDRIGHFVADSAILLALKSLHGKKYLYLPWFDGEASNTYFNDKVNRVLNVNKVTMFVSKAYNLLSFGDKHNSFNNYGSRDTDCILYKTKNIKSSYFRFNLNENRLGFEYLGRNGFNQGDKFVCLMVRDSAYLDSMQSNNDWKYHNYRDSSIHTYKLMAEELARRGYFVIRMGKVVKEKFESKSKKIIDYAFSNDRSDFLDIWLMSNCFFCVTTATGLDKVCSASRVPQVFVNSLPLCSMTSFDHCIWASKKLFWKSTGNLLTMNETLDKNYFNSQDYFRDFIDIVDLNDAEIKDIVMEMEEKLTGKWRESSVDQVMQMKFWKIFKQHKNYKKYNNCIHPNAQYATSFLRNNPHWLV